MDEGEDLWCTAVTGESSIPFKRKKRYVRRNSFEEFIDVDRDESLNQRPRLYETEFTYDEAQYQYEDDFKNDEFVSEHSNKRNKRSHSVQTSANKNSHKSRDSLTTYRKQGSIENDELNDCVKITIRNDTKKFTTEARQVFIGEKTNLAEQPQGKNFSKNVRPKDISGRLHSYGGDVSCNSKADDIIEIIDSDTEASNILQKPFKKDSFNLREMGRNNDQFHGHYDSNNNRYFSHQEIPQNSYIETFDLLDDDGNQIYLDTSQGAQNEFLQKLYKDEAFRMRTEIEDQWNKGRTSNEYNQRGISRNESGSLSDDRPVHIRGNRKNRIDSSEDQSSCHGYNNKENLDYFRFHNRKIRAEGGKDKYIGTGDKTVVAHGTNDKNQYSNTIRKPESYSFERNMQYSNRDDTDRYRSSPPLQDRDTPFSDFRRDINNARTMKNLSDSRVRDLRDDGVLDNYQDRNQTRHDLERSSYKGGSEDFSSNVDYDIYPSTRDRNNCSKTDDDYNFRKLDNVELGRNKALGKRDEDYAYHDLRKYDEELGEYSNPKLFNNLENFDDTQSGRYSDFPVEDRYNGPKNYSEEVDVFDRLSNENEYKYRNNDEDEITDELRPIDYYSDEQCLARNTASISTVAYTDGRSSRSERHDELANTDKLDGCTVPHNFGDEYQHRPSDTQRIRELNDNLVRGHTNIALDPLFDSLKRGDGIADNQEENEYKRKRFLTTTGSEVDTIYDHKKKTESDRSHLDKNDRGRDHRNKHNSLRSPAFRNENTICETNAGAKNHNNSERRDRSLKNSKDGVPSKEQRNGIEYAVVDNQNSGNTTKKEFRKNSYDSVVAGYNDIIFIDDDNNEDHSGAEKEKKENSEKPKLERRNRELQEKRRKRSRSRDKSRFRSRSRDKPSSPRKLERQERVRQMLISAGDESVTQYKKSKQTAALFASTMFPYISQPPTQPFNYIQPIILSYNPLPSAIVQPSIMEQQLKRPVIRPSFKVLCKGKKSVKSSSVKVEHKTSTAVKSSNQVTSLSEIDKQLALARRASSTSSTKNKVRVNITKKTNTSDTSPITTPENEKKVSLAKIENEKMNQRDSKRRKPWFDRECLRLHQKRKKKMSQLMKAQQPPCKSEKDIAIIKKSLREICNKYTTMNREKRQIYLDALEEKGDYKEICKNVVNNLVERIVSYQRMEAKGEGKIEDIINRRYNINTAKSVEIIAIDDDDDDEKELKDDVDNALISSGNEE